MVRSKFFMIGFFFVFAMVLIAVIGPSRVVYPEIQNNLNERLKPPEGFARGFQGHILGTDQLGQDIFTRVIIGSRSSLIISFSSVFLSALLGTILGLVAGYFQGAVETVIMRIGDIQLSIPSLVLAIAVVAVLGPSVSNLILVLTFTGWIRFARIVRTDTMITRGKEFISASRVLGGSSFHIITTQILPNVLTSLIILTSQQFGFIILVEASLSFLGLGVPLPKASWGSMISAGRAYITTAPWLVLVPGFILMIAVLAFNFLGDGVRDVLDPKMKH
jgi:peptide/nickel transport system permease protein